MLNWPLAFNFWLSKKTKYTDSWCWKRKGVTGWQRGGNPARPRILPPHLASHLTCLTTNLTSHLTCLTSHLTSPPTSPYLPHLPPHLKPHLPTAFSVRLPAFEGLSVTVDILLLVVSIVLRDWLRGELTGDDPSCQVGRYSSSVQLRQQHKPLLVAGWAACSLLLKSHR